MYIVGDEIDDYYDVYYNSTYNRMYNRQRSNVGKLNELDKLRKIGIKTIDIREVSNIIGEGNRQIMVYTDIKKHSGDGKKIMDINMANMMYSNYVGTEYYENIKSIQKMVQVGERRFMCTVEVEDGREVRWVSIEERKKGYNYKLGLPIYSIDYLEVGSEIIACDFNEIQKLAGTGIDKIMTDKEVAEEVFVALQKYKK